MEAESPGRSLMQPSHATILEKAFQLPNPPPEKDFSSHWGTAILLAKG